jgi:hypothetical protein
MNINDQLGLGYLNRPRSASDADQLTPGSLPNPSATPVAPREAILTFGRPMLDDLAEAGGSARLWDLIEKRRIPIDICLRLVDAFEQDGLLEVQERDLKGNHGVRITTKGRSVIAR